MSAPKFDDGEDAQGQSEENWDPFGDVPMFAEHERTTIPRERWIALGPRYSTDDLREPWDRADWS